MTTPPSQACSESQIEGDNSRQHLSSARQEGKSGSASALVTIVTVSVYRDLKLRLQRGQVTRPGPVT